MYNNLTITLEGTSHGKGYSGSISGIPSGYTIDTDIINEQLHKRKSGIGRSVRQNIERDIVTLGGLHNGVTTTQPITFFVDNNVVNQEDRDNITALRSGHIDVVVAMQYGADTVRYHNEHASARNSLCYVVLGSIASQVIEQMCGITISSHVTNIGGITASLDSVDNTLTQDMVQAIAHARQCGDSVGGKVSIVATNVPQGLGNYFPYSNRIDGQLCGDIMSIPTVKAVEVGLGVEYANLPTTKVADQLELVGNTIQYSTNNCGGIVGGMTTGQPIILTATVKGVPTVKGGDTIDSITHQVVPSHYERADTCVVENVGIIASNMVALRLLDILIR